MNALPFFRVAALKISFLSFDAAKVFFDFQLHELLFLDFNRIEKKTHVECR